MEAASCVGEPHTDDDSYRAYKVLGDDTSRLSAAAIRRVVEDWRSKASVDGVRARRSSLENAAGAKGLLGELCEGGMAMGWALCRAEGHVADVAAAVEELKAVAGLCST